MSEYKIKSIEDDIVSRLENGERVYIESGAANDEITSYSIRKFKTYAWQEYEEKEITFTTTACIFPERINLSDWSNVDTEEFNGKLFVHVW